MATPSPWLPEETFEAQWESAIADGMVAAEAPTLEELAEKLDLPTDALRETVNRWNADVTAGTDTAFGRTKGLGTIETPPFYAMRLKPAIVQTLGGLRITPDAQALDKDGHIIPGLFAAGQVTGGVHGADYIGGSALLEIAVFGAIAGTKAVNLDADPFN
jgi:fumarate reductase flavoprotein subunit